MDALETILTRRSVRKFKSEPIEKSIIEQLLRAAMSAPSAGNAEPWHFIIVDDRKILNEIARTHPHAQMCAEAPLAIITCADPEMEKYKGFFPQDLAAASENILLTARALGLGAVWVGVYPLEDRILEIKKILNLPAMIIPFNIIPIGFTDAEQGAAESRYNPDRIHYNKW
jgi:nitroreductase